MFLHLRPVHPKYFHITDSGVGDFDSGNSRIVALASTYPIGLVQEILELSDMSQLDKDYRFSHVY